MHRVSSIALDCSAIARFYAVPVVNSVTLFDRCSDGVFARSERKAVWRSASRSSPLHCRKILGAGDGSEVAVRERVQSSAFPECQDNQKCLYSVSPE
jgi:hypothetical protein